MLASAMDPTPQRAQGMFTAAHLMQCFRTSHLLRNRSDLHEAVGKAVAACFPQLFESAALKAAIDKMPGEYTVWRTAFHVDLALMSMEKDRNASGDHPWILVAICRNQDGWSHNSSLFCATSYIWPSPLQKQISGIPGKL